MSQMTEAEILAMIKDPSSRDQGFLLLMNTYQKKLYWLIRRLVVSHEDAEDILQETFILVYHHIGGFKGESSLYTWLYRIATNECNRYFKKQGNRLKQVELLDEHISGLVGDEHTENSDAMLYKFQRAIQELPAKQKIVFNLRYYDELSYEEIAKILNTSEGTLRTSYHFAYEKIKKYLIDHA